MSRQTQRQGELAGLERKKIDEIEAEAVIEREGVQERQDAKLKVRDSLLRMQGLLRKYDESGELEKNEDGDPCYVAIDGEERNCYVLESNERVVVKKLKEQEPPPGAEIG